MADVWRGLRNSLYTHAPGYLASGAYYGGRYLYDRAFAMPAISTTTPGRTPRRFIRTYNMAGRKVFRRYRPKYRRRRFAKKKVGFRRGRRYRGYTKKVSRPLGTNFGINDYKSIRVVHMVRSFSVQEGAVLQNNFRADLKLDHWVTQWNRIITGYQEFKFSNVQFVIQPRNPSYSDANLKITSGQTPYLALRTVVPTSGETLLVDQDELRQTPGVRYIPLLKRSRTVHNVQPSMQQITNMLQPGTNPTVEFYKKMPWVNRDTATTASLFGAIEVTIPQMDVLDGKVLDYDMYVYATIHLRGNTGEIIPPYDE